MHTKNWNPLIYGCKNLKYLSFVSCNKVSSIYFCLFFCHKSKVIFFIVQNLGLTRVLFTAHRFKLGSHCEKRFMHRKVDGCEQHSRHGPVPHRLEPTAPLLSGVLQLLQSARHRPKRGLDQNGEPDHAQTRRRPCHHVEDGTADNKPATPAPRAVSQ